MTQQSHMISNINPAMSTTIFRLIILLLPLIKPCFGILYSPTTFFNGDIFAGQVGQLSYTGTCITSNGNYTHGNAYESNLLTVFSNLTTAAAASKRFSNATAGTSSNNKAYAWYYCLHNVTPKECLTCVANFTKFLLEKCTTKQAIVYTSDCVLHYADQLTFPEDDSSSNLYCNDIGAAVADPVSLNHTVVTSIQKLIDQVTALSPSEQSSRSYYLTVASDSYLNQKVYTAVQCAFGVISRRECKDCLTRALNETLQCLNMGTTLGVDYRPNCRIRYDLQPFGDAPASATAPAPAPGSFSANLSPPANTPNRAGSRRSRTLLCITAAAVILLTLY